jgi:hypothetical protein
LCVPCCQWLDVSFHVVFCLPSSCVLCVPCCQWLWMFHSVLCFVCLPPMSYVSHVVSNSWYSNRVVFCLPSSCVLCVPCCQWLWMLHSVLCIA